MKSKLLHKLIIGIFVSLYLITSTISTIHSIDFFGIANSYLMSIFLAVAYEVGAASSLAALVIKDKLNMFLVWSIFIVLTLFQIMNNVYFSFVHLGDFSKWSELFGLNEEDILMQKRIVSIVLGAVLPLIALGFIKALVDYISPTKNAEDTTITLNEPLTKVNKTIIEDKKVHEKEPTDTLKDVKDNTDKLTKETIHPIEQKSNHTEQIDSILNDDLGNNLNSIRRGGM